MHERQLAEALCLLAQTISEATKAKTAEFKWLKAHFELATKRDLELMENRIMSKISDFLTKQEQFNTEQEASIDEVVAAVGGVASDVAELNRIIKELQDSSGGVTPEDAARIDAIEAKGAALSAKLAGVATAVKDLDAQHPPTVPPPV